MSGGGSGGTQSTTNVTKVELSPEQRELLGLAMPQLRQFAGTTGADVIPPFSSVAGFDPAQTAGQEQVLSAVPGMAGVTEGAAKNLGFVTNPDILRAESNPALAGIRDTIRGETRGAVDDLLESALPSVRSGARMAGQYGGSRQGIAEGLAVGKASRNVGDIAAKIGTDVGMKGYTAGLDAMTRGLGLSPEIARSLMIPGVATSGVGDVRQGLQQALLDEQTQRFNTQTMWPLLLGQQYAGIMSGIPGAGATSTVTGPAPKSNSLLQALGIGAAGASALSSILPLLPFSDRRTKQDIKQIGTFRGVPWYSFKYLGDTVERMGVMSDEVPSYAVLRFNGVDLVDYGAL